eukprot:gene14099-18919_t
MEEVAEALWGNEKYILGPMVRASSLPLRLACLEYGADTVYSEEIPAWRVLKCERIVNPILNTIDYVSKISHSNKTEVLFRFDPIAENNRCVLQLGCNNSNDALKASLLFEKDVAAIDINMGCPKHYSISNGMGSELMHRPEIAEDIIKTLRRNLSVPISVKTRIFDIANSLKTASGSDIDVPMSIEWIQRLVNCGVHAIAVHGRTPKQTNSSSIFEEIYSIINQKISNKGNCYFIGNGDLWSNCEIKRLKKTSGIKAFMLSRAALWNPSIFSTLKCKRQDNELSEQPDLIQLLANIVKLSAKTANCPLNTRYLMQQILAGNRSLNCSIRNKILTAFNLISLSKICECYNDVNAERQRQLNRLHNLQFDSITQKKILNNKDNNKENTSSDIYNEHEYFLNLVNNDFKYIVPQASLIISTTLCSNNNSDNNNNNTNYNNGDNNSSNDYKLDSIISVEDNILKQNRYKQFKKWPGLVCNTSHEYNDKYFDDNYYTAFRKCSSNNNSNYEDDLISCDNINKETSLVKPQTTGNKKRSFEYSGWITTNIERKPSHARFVNSTDDKDLTCSI